MSRDKVKCCQSKKYKVENHYFNQGTIIGPTAKTPKRTTHTGNSVTMFLKTPNYFSKSQNQ